MRMDALNEITLTHVCEAITVYSERGRRLDMHCRPRYGLSFCRSGEIVYTHKGRRIVSEPGVAILLPKGESYRLEGSKTGEFPLINFEADCDIHDFIVLPLWNEEGYLREFEALRELLLTGRDRLRVMAMLYGILSRLSADAAGKRDALAPILSYLEKNYGDPGLSNALLAEKGGISEVYMRQLFRERLHTSPKQYVTALRMQKANQLLTQSNATVGDVAAACGFTSIHHFSAAFSAATGQSPTVYRRENRKEIL